MLNLFTLGQTTDELQAQLPEIFERLEREIAAAKPIFVMEGERLERLARDVPLYQAKYAQLAQEAKAVGRWLEILKGQKLSKYTKNYNNSPRSLGVKEQSVYLQGEPEVVEVSQLIAAMEHYLEQLNEIVEAIKQMGWMIGHITKLRVAELQEAII